MAAVVHNGRMVRTLELGRVRINRRDFLAGFGRPYVELCEAIAFRRAWWVARQTGANSSTRSVLRILMREAARRAVATTRQSRAATARYEATLP